MNIDINVSQALIWFSLLHGVATVAIGITVWIRKPGEDAGEAVVELRNEVTEQMGELSGRLTAVETHMKHMPTSEELAAIDGSVKQVDERTKGLAEAVSTIRMTLNRIENYLLTPK